MVLQNNVDLLFFLHIIYLLHSATQQGGSSQKVLQSTFTFRRYSNCEKSPILHLTGMLGVAFFLKTGTKLRTCFIGHKGLKMKVKDDFQGFYYQFYFVTKRW